MLITVPISRERDAIWVVVKLFYTIGIIANSVNDQIWKDNFWLVREIFQHSVIAIGLLKNTDHMIGMIISPKLLFAYKSVI